MASAVRNGGRHRWRVFHSHRSLDGPVLHGFGRCRPVLSLELAERAAGGGLRRLTHYFWSRHREEIWWLNQERIVASVLRATSAIGELPRRRGPPKIPRRIWTA